MLEQKISKFVESEKPKLKNQLKSFLSLKTKLKNYLIPIAVGSVISIGGNKAIANNSFVRYEATATQNGDVNGDRTIDVNDVHYLLDYLFNEGPAPVPITSGLPVTSQTKCYDNENEIPCPAPGEPFHGQDGNYQAGVQRKFEVVKPDPNDDSTWYTVDHVTGLMWQYKNDGIARYWKDALVYCESLELGGFDDWRTPNIRELESIVDYGRTPAINTEAFFHEQGKDWYWSSTTCTKWPSYAWFVSFYNGEMNPDSKRWKQLFVRVVRTLQPLQNGDVNGDRRIDVNDVHYLLENLFNEGPAPVPIITGLPVTGQTKCYDRENEIPCPNPGQPFYGQDGNNQAGTPRKFEVVKPNPYNDSTWYTIDHVTRLMWQYKNDGIRNWQEALAYCENLELGGFNDWRLPNVRELDSIVDYGSLNPSITPDSFLIDSYDEYRRHWAATTVPQGENHAFIGGFSYGGIWIEMKEDITYFISRAVRTIQPGDFPQRTKTLEADLDDNGIVDFKDFSKFAEQWLRTEDWYDLPDVGN